MSTHFYTQNSSDDSAVSLLQLPLDPEVDDEGKEVPIHAEL